MWPAVCTTHRVEAQPARFLTASRAPARPRTCSESVLLTEAANKGKEPDLKNAAVILGLGRAEPPQAKPPWPGATAGPRRGYPGSGALGHWTKRYREVPAWRTSGLPLLGGWSTGPQCVKRQVIQKSFDCGSRYVLLFIYRGAWCSENSP